MPEQLLGRIIRTCSNPGDLVLDPFSGSATTLAVAKKLGRQFLGFDLSEQYITRGLERLASIQVGDALDGSPEPTMSAPTTATGKRLSSAGQAQRSVPPAKLTVLKKTEDIQAAIIDAFRHTHDGFSADRVVIDPGLDQPFIERCMRSGVPGSTKEINLHLLRLRKSGRLANEVQTTHQTKVDTKRMDQYLDAAEIAWRRMLDLGYLSLDSILSCPHTAQNFDLIASQFAPGFTSFEYRWAALSLRKLAKSVRNNPPLEIPTLGRKVLIEDIREKSIPHEPGAYVVYSRKGEALFFGQTFDLFGRISRQIDQARTWKQFTTELQFCWKPLAFKSSNSQKNLFSLQPAFVKKLKPLLNVSDVSTAHQNLGG